MNLNLTPELESLINEKVTSGLYNSASEVVREALRLMQTHDEFRHAKLEALRRDIQEGLDDIKAGRVRNGKEVMAEIKNGLEKKRKK